MESQIPDTEHVVLKEEPILAALPENHPCNALAKYSPGLEYPYLELADLEGQTLILPEPQQSIRLAVQRLLDENHVHPSRIIEITHLAVILRMVSEGLGIGFYRQVYLKDMPSSEGIRYYYLGNPPSCSNLVLLYPKRQKNHRIMTD